MAVNARWTGRVVVGICLATLALTSGVLFAAGAHKNAQISALHQHGVPVEVTVSRCLGLLGGSGSNAAGYACRGTYRMGGRTYDEAIPGTTLRAPGATVRAVAVAGDPGLMSTASAMATGHPSWTVFVVPTVLLVVLVLLAGALLLRRQHIRRVSSANRPG